MAKWHTDRSLGVNEELQAEGRFGRIADRGLLCGGDRRFSKGLIRLGEPERWLDRSAPLTGWRLALDLECERPVGPGLLSPGVEETSCFFHCR